MSVIMSQETFKFGICGHNPKHGICKGYPRNMTKEHIRLAYELGVKIYRFDADPTDIDWMDELVETAQSYDMELMAIIYDAAGEAKKIAERYKGKIKYYQIHNEIDCWTFKTIPNQPDASGREFSHYKEEPLVNAAKLCKEIIAEIRSVDTDARICINGTWMHFGMIDYMLECGVEFDLLGWDWYSQMEKEYGIDACLEDLMKYDMDVIFCETNISEAPEKYRAEYLSGLMKKLYNHPSGKVKGMIVYELMDEPTHDNEKERTYGLVCADEQGNAIGLKDAYLEIQKLLV